MKRFFDFIFSSIVIILFFPLGTIIILILLYTGEGEVLYKQPRIGKFEKTFGLFKFATMIKDSPNMGAGDITLKNDPRVLPFGKFLRKTKLNEFPQFLNVFIGDMSIVGPRPLVKNQFDMIPNNLKEKIKLLKPGITGIGSIIFRDEEKYLQIAEMEAQKFYKTEIVPFKAKLECWYHDNVSMLIDILLIVVTVLSLLLPEMRLHKHFFSGLPRHKLFNS